MIDIYRVPRNTSPGHTHKFPCLVLEEDNWDDFGYVTLFHVKWFTSSGRSVVLADTKILQQGKTHTALRQRLSIALWAKQLNFTNRCTI